MQYLASVSTSVSMWCVLI